MPTHRLNMCDFICSLFWTNDSEKSWTRANEDVHLALPFRWRWWQWGAAWYKSAVVLCAIIWYPANLDGVQNIHHVYATVFFIQCKHLISTCAVSRSTVFFWLCIMHPVSGSHQSCSKRGLFVVVLPGHLLYLDFWKTYSRLFSVMLLLLILLYRLFKSRMIAHDKQSKVSFLYNQCCCFLLDDLITTWE